MIMSIQQDSDKQQPDNGGPTPEVRDVTDAVRRFIKQETEQTGESQTSWCKRIGIEESTLRSVINPGKKGPTIDTYLKIAKGAGVPLSVLIGENSDCPNRTPGVSVEIEREIIFKAIDVSFSQLFGPDGVLDVRSELFVKIVNLVYSRLINERKKSKISDDYIALVIKDIFSIVNEIFKRP